MNIKVIKNELIKMKETFFQLNKDQQLKIIIDIALNRIDNWKVSKNKDEFEIIPYIPELMGFTTLEVNKLNNEKEEFVSLNYSSKNNYYSWGFNNSSLLLNIPPMSDKFLNNIFLYQHEEDFVDKFNIGNIKGIQLNKLDEDNLRLNSITRKIYFNRNVAAVIILNINLNFSVFIYIYNSLNRIERVERIEFDTDFKITFNNQYTISYKNNVINSITDIHGILSYSKQAEIDESKFQYREVFKNFELSTIEQINKYLTENKIYKNNLELKLKNDLSKLKYDELEELLESIYTIYSLPEDKEILDYLKIEYQLYILNNDMLHNILVIIQNSIQDLIDDI